MFFQHLLWLRNCSNKAAKSRGLLHHTGMENRLLKNHDIPIYQIDIQGVRGNGLVRKAIGTL